MNTFWLDMLGGEVRYYQAGGIRTRVLEAGTGPPLLLLHGTGGHAESFIRNIVPLGAHFHVYALDLVGHGFSDKPPLDYTPRDYAAHVVAFLDAIGAQQAHLNGESLGGWVALWVALEHPERVGRLVLNTTAGLKLSAAQLVVPPQRAEMARLTRAAVEQPSPETVRARLEWLVKDKTLITDELVATRLRIYQQPATQRVMPRILAGAALGQGAEQNPYVITPERLRQVPHPTLVLWTSDNPGMSWQEARAAAALLPRGQFHLLRDCAHWPQYEVAAEYNRLVTRFLLDQGL
ncbi:MAG TPA: alpha/beta fold hydrolase [Chloroflexota bacterium]|nr:alpha/beta fold hydrolase [Chloroflexota bacterium]